MARQISEHAEVAKIIRKRLKAEGIEARVRARTASMMTAVDVCLVDAPPSIVAKVEDWVDQFREGDFCGMTDCFNYRKGRSGPTVKYLHVTTEFSADMKNAAWKHARQTVAALADSPDCEITERYDFRENAACDRTLDPIEDARFFNDPYASPRDVAHRVLASRDDAFGFWRSIKPRVRAAA